MTAINTLRERIESYEDSTDYKLLKKLPIITIVNGRAFQKATSLLEKPFSSDFIELMCATMIKLCHEMDGAVFAYSFNDEIVIVSRNDQNLGTEAWYDNRIQKIVSAAASIATLEFNKRAGVNKIQLFGDPIFTAKSFVVPNVVEAINVLVAKQQQAFHIAISMASFHELLKKHSLDIVKQSLAEKTASEKAELLFDECGIDFNSFPLPFRRGFACYRAPKLHGEEIKNKLTIDMEIPIFTKDHDFLANIFRSGKDIFRAKRDV